MKIEPRLTTAEINQWIDNDEGLYNWWKSSKQRKGDFLRENRRAIEASIKDVMWGVKPAHHLAYSGGFR